MANERLTRTERQRILKVRLRDSSYVWLLFSAKRKLWECDDFGGKRGVNDELEIEVYSLGSFDGTVRVGDRIMEMRGTASSVSETVHFSNGYIVVEDPWKGLYIGTYMMNCLVSWAIENYHNYRPVAINLLSCQASEENKTRRNRFYQRFGFKFKWADEECEEGSLDPDLRVSSLNTVKRWKGNIEEVDIIEAVKHIFWESSLTKLEFHNTKNSMRIAQAERDAALASKALSESKKVLWGLIGVIVGILTCSFF